MSTGEKVSELTNEALATFAAKGDSWLIKAMASEILRLRSSSDDAKDAARYRWLRDHKCNSLHLTRDGDHACNYVTATQWIEEYRPEDFAEDDPSEVQRMKDTNTIWSLQIYPDTPIGSYLWHGSTLDSAVDSAMSQETP